MKALKSSLLVAAGLAVAYSAAAHHSFAMFDASKRNTVSGTVKAFEWAAPHVWVWISADDGSGGIRTYGFESLDPVALRRWSGWSKHSLNVGDRVTVEWHPLKDGNDGGSLIKITFADGHTLESQQLVSPAS
jgi:hypothetical protein